MARPEKVRLGDLLVNAQLITQQQLDLALTQQGEGGRRLGRLLVENKFISEAQISEALAKQFDIAFIDLKHYNLNPDLVRLLPEGQARRYRSIVLAAHDDVLTVGMADPTDQAGFDEMSHLLKSAIEIVVVTEGQVLESIDRGYRRTDDIGGHQKYGSGEALSPRQHLAASAKQTTGASEVTISKQIQAMLEAAVRERASDIHIESHDKQYRYRLRVDGVLVGGIALPHKITESVVLRLKLMAELDIAERTLPLAGRFQARVDALALEVRVSVCPVGKGESLVLHLSYQDAQRSTDALGMPELMVARLREIMLRGKGMLVFTGPSGGGKSTTLLAALAELDADNLKIISVEDPVEHNDPRLYQMQVDALGGLDFSAAVRASLHQDPDVLVLHELPNAEVMRSALHAAADGKRVFAAQNGYDATGALCYFSASGLPRYMAAAAIHAIVAQHLLRRVCGHCAEVHVYTQQESIWLEMEGLDVQQLGHSKRGKGCAQCHGTGYQGRVAVFEMLEMRQPLVDAAAHDSISMYMLEAAKQMQGKSLTAHALGLVSQGQTSLSEVMRMSNRHPA